MIKGSIKPVFNTTKIVLPNRTTLSRRHYRLSLKLDSFRLKPGALTRWKDSSPNNLVLSRLNASANDPTVVQVREDANIVRFAGSQSIGVHGVAIKKIVNNRCGTIVFVSKTRRVLTAPALIRLSTGATNVLLTYADITGDDWIVDWGDSSAGAGAGRLTFANTSVDGFWHVYMLVRNGQTLSLYKDNVLVGTGTLSLGISDGSGSLIVGFDNTTAPSGNGFDGDIAEIRCYKHAMNQQEMEYHYQLLREKWNSLFTKSEINSLVAHWDANDITTGVGNTVTNFPARVGGTDYDFNTTTGTGPILRNSLGVLGVEFAGTGFLRTTGNLNPFSEKYNITQLLVVSNGTQVDAFSNILDHSHSSGTANNWVWQQDNANVRWTFGWYTSAGNHVAASITHYLTPDATPTVLAVRKSGGDIVMQKNLSVNDNYGGSTSLSFANTAKRINLGGNADFNRRFVGQIHEVKLYNTNLTDSELSKEIRQLGLKWGISM